MFDGCFPCSILLQQLQNIGEKLQAARKDSVHPRDGDAVIDDGDGLRHGRGNAVLHRSFVEHTAAAMHDDTVFGEVRGELSARGKAVRGLDFREILNPFRHLDGADVVALTVVGTALGNQHAVAVP